MSGLVNVPRTPSPAAKTPRTPVSPLSSGQPLSRTGRYLPEPYTSEERQKRIDAVVDREKEAQVREDELRSELSRLNDANECLIGRNGTLAKENKVLTQKVAELEEQAQDAQDLQVGLQDRADKMQDQLGELQGENTSLRTQMNNKNRLLMEQSSNAEQIKELKSTVETLREENEEKIKSLNLQISELQDGAEKHRQEAESLEAKVGKAESEKDSADRELKKVESKYQDNLANLNQQISSKDAAVKLWKARYGKAFADWQEAERCRGLARQDAEHFKALLDVRDKRITGIHEDLSREKTKHAEKAKELKKAHEDLANLKKTADEDQYNAVERLEAQKAAEKRADDLKAELQQALEQNKMSTEATTRLQAAEQEASDKKRKLQAAESKILELEQEAEARDKEDTELFELQQARHLGRERRKRERSGNLNGDGEPEAKRLRSSPEDWNPEDDPSF